MLNALYQAKQSPKLLHSEKMVLDRLQALALAIDKKLKQ